MEVNLVARSGAAIRDAAHIVHRIIALIAAAVWYIA
jgi:hypothetical protein